MRTDGTISVFRQNQQVANGLVLTEGMRNRGEPFLATGRLRFRPVCTEDIFPFKMIAGRDDDIGNMNALVRAGLDCDVVGNELEAQIDRLGDDQFATVANEAPIELEDRILRKIEASVFSSLHVGVADY